MRALGWRARALSGVVADDVASAVVQLDDLGLASTRWLCRVASGSAFAEKRERALHRLTRVWPYRTKTPENLWGQFWQAQLDLERGRAAPARAALEALRYVDPGNPWILEMLAQARVALGDRTGALAAIEEARQAVPRLRTLPRFDEGPREPLGASGDHAVVMFERVLRRFEKSSMQYNMNEWAALVTRLDAQARALQAR